MDDNFSKAMKIAGSQIRGGALEAATRTIQAALGGRSAAAEQRAMKVINPDPEPALPTGTKPRRKSFPLREVVQVLRRKPAPRVAPVDEPADGSFALRRHATAAGSRDFRLFVPQGDAPRGLIVMLHGCTQTAQDFAAGTGMNRVAQAHGLLVAYPEQTGQHNAASCWNWFQPGDQRRGVGEPAILASLTEALMAEYGLTRDAVFVAGLSAGGAMAAVMAEAYPELFAAVGVHSGLPVGAASDVMGAFSAMRSGAPGTGQVSVPTIVFHGTADTTVHPANAMHVVAAAAAGTAGTAHSGTAPGGRRYDRTVHRAVDGTAKVELWLIDGAGHAWSGGHAAGSYTDPSGPDASSAMVRFFLTGNGAG